MESERVYNSTTVPAGGRNRNYLDNVSYASLNPRRCANVTIVIFGILFFLGGLALSLYGGLFYLTVREPDRNMIYELPLDRQRREHQMLIYQVLLFAGIPVLVLGLILWIVYLSRSGRCRYCPLCPGAKKRRRRREDFEAQMAEEDRISNGYSTHPTTTLPLDEQDRLVKASMDDYAGLEDTDAMLAPSHRPVLVPMQTTI